jgi:hypothetical protein
MSFSSQFIQDDFVKERQAASSNKNAGKTGVVTSDDLITRMMVAKYVFFALDVGDVRTLRADDFCPYVHRLLAATLHEPEVTTEVWERAKSLDAQRKARLL